MFSSIRRRAAIAAAFGMTLASGAAMAAGDVTNSAPAGGPIAPAAASQCKGCFAVVNANGTLLRGKSVVSTTRLSAGTYDIRFKKQIGKCAWTATIGVGTFGGSVPGGEITLAGRAGTNNGIFLQTFNSAGAATDLPFHLLISC